MIGASTRDYYYSLGWQVLEERVAGALERQFVWEVRHIDDLVLRDRGAERLYAVHDAMHVTAVTNASGAVQERYGYDGFGKPRFMDASFGARASSSFDWETLFDGYRFDTETGLYQVRFRSLHPGLGRWISRDPADYSAGISLYRFVKNRPTVLWDLSGLWIEDEDGFPILETGTPLDAYFWDRRTKQEHDRTMEEGWDAIAEKGEELLLACLPFGLGRLGKLGAIAGVLADLLYGEIGDKALADKEYKDKYEQIKDRIARGKQLVRDKGFLRAFLPGWRGLLLGIGTGAFMKLPTRAGWWGTLTIPGAGYWIYTRWRDRYRDLWRDDH